MSGRGSSPEKPAERGHLGAPSATARGRNERCQTRWDPGRNLNGWARSNPGIRSSLQLPAPTTSRHRSRRPPNGRPAATANVLVPLLYGGMGHLGLLEMLRCMGHMVRAVLRWRSAGRACDSECRYRVAAPRRSPARRALLCDPGTICLAPAERSVRAVAEEVVACSSGRWRVTSARRMCQPRRRVHRERG